jgi:tRNA (adenine22-N1)-methyltransferase
MNLDKRLGTVAALVRHGARVADIGTDHAYLPVYLLQAGVCPSAIASDIGEGPLEAARHTVTAAGLTDKISLRLGDGLAGIAPDEAEDIVIAGMGGETIAAILQAAPWVKNPALRLILQPMTRAEDLRCWLLQNGFSVLQERLVQDGRHLYPVLAAEYPGAVCTAELPCYAGFFDPEEGRPYRRMMAGHLRRRADGLRHGGEEGNAAHLTALADALDKL